MRIGAHAASPARGKLSQLGPEAPAGVEKIPGSVALHPLFKDVYMRRVLMHFSHWHLVRAPVVLGAFTIDLFRARPTLGCAKYDHRPVGSLGKTVRTRVGFDTLNFAADIVQSGGHQIMHRCGLMPLDEMRGVAIAAEQLIQLLVTDAG